MIKASELGRCDVTRHALAYIEQHITAAPEQTVWSSVLIDKNADMKRIKYVMGEAGYEVKYGELVHGMRGVVVSVAREIRTIETCFDVDVDLKIQRDTDVFDFMLGLKQVMSQYIQGHDLATSYTVKEVER